jgi:threonine dehydrogenase-like Zn-dependent dehydrogenase
MLCAASSYAMLLQPTSHTLGQIRRHHSSGCAEVIVHPEKCTPPVVGPILPIAGAAIELMALSYKIQL